MPPKKEESKLIEHIDAIPLKEHKPRVGDPAWTMRRRMVIAVFGYCAALPVYAFQFPQDRINAVAGLMAPISAIVMPVLISYLGIVEYGRKKPNAEDAKK